MAVGQVDRRVEDHLIAIIHAGADLDCRAEIAHHRHATDMGDAVYAGGKQVGVITCAMYSTLTGKSMAIARLSVPVAVHGTRLEVRGKKVNGPAVAHTLPFDDPQKKKRTAVG